MEAAFAETLEARPYAIRTPTAADLPALVAIEQVCWADGLRTPLEQLRRRIERFPSGQFLLEMDRRPVAILYTQRLADRALPGGTTAATVEDLHTPSGRIVQLLALNVLPEMQHLGLGDELLSFVLQLCSVDETVEHILAVSLCRDYRGERAIGLEDYIRLRDERGRLVDPILGFHEAHGAEITGVVPGYRPADRANLGSGVLVEYRLDQLHASGPQTQAAPPAAGSARSPSGPAPLAIVEACIQRVKPGLDPIPVRRPLMECGFDSLDLLQLRLVLSEHFDVALNPAFFFSHGTVEAIASYFQENRETPIAVPERQAGALAPQKDAVAIVGMACRLPGGVVSTDQFWELLREGRDAISEVPRSRWSIDALPAGHSMGTRYGGFVDDVDQFDAAFFNIGAKEANALDPQQRLLLEVAWEALERAGIDPTSLVGARAGIFVGIFSHDYELLQVKRNAAGGGYDPHYATGSSASVAAGRLAYVLGCHGPALAVDTACSSSLVAVHLACRSLLSGECDVAIAGGVNLILSPELSLSFANAGMLSPQGRCKTFDEAADGYVRSEGCGLVVLKSLSRAVRDGDHVLAVIRGTAINHDGFSNGLTAPNGLAQEQVMREALAAAGVSPRDVSYVEAHGTGTPLGDPVEVRAIANVYGQRRDAGAPLLVGSVKANIGHAEAAAGIAGLMKVVLAQQHHHLPAQLHFHTPNPDLELQSVPIVIPTEGADWTPPDRETRLLAGVSSFGFSGTNAHVIVEEAPAAAFAAVERSRREWHAFTLSAASQSALKELAARFEAHLDDHPDAPIEDLCHTVNTGRAHLDWRLGAAVRSTAELVPLLRSFRDGAHDEWLVTGRVARTAGERSADEERAWPSARDEVLDLLKRHVAGAFVDWRAFGRGRGSRMLTLPTYPFEHRRYWLGADSTATSDARPQPASDSAASLDGLLYKVEWHPRSVEGDVAAALAAPRAIAERLGGTVIPNPSYDGLLADLEDLSVAYVVEAFSELGCDVNTAIPELAALGVVEEQRRFAARLVEILRDAGGTGAAGRQSAEERRTVLLSRHPAAEAELTMLGRCASRLADVLRGTVDPLGLLFPEADLTSATRLYEQSATFAPMNRLLCETVREAIWALPAGSRLRVLEIGAGTGGTTASLVALLGDGADEYVFSDVSPLFVRKARDRFGDLAFMNYGVLDIEREPGDQGYEAAHFDLVIASNVVHATRDLRSTLRHVRSLVAPGGMLMLVEGSRHRRWVDLIFGMLGGWWRFADHDLRPTCPLLPAAAWEQLLTEAGFCETASLVPRDDSGLFEQSVLVARTPLKEAAAADVRSRHWIVFSDRHGIGNQLSARIEQRGDTYTRVAIEPDGAPPGREALAAVVQKALRSHSRVDGCIHLWSLDVPDGQTLSVDALETANKTNCASLLHLAQALSACELAEPPRLWLVTRGAVAADGGTLPGVGQSPLLGLGQVLSAEHPEFRCTHVDLDPASRGSDVDRLADEILSDASGRRVAFRAGVRMEAQLTRLDADRQRREPSALRPDRSYLIAGGLGALGLEVAQLLVARGARHLVLAGRTAAAGRDRRVAATLGGLERRGATVRIIPADISKAGDVERLLGQIADAGPALGGVVHAAGVFQDRLLADHDWPSFSVVLSAKVSGAWNLHVATRAMPLDFFVLFGSATSLICSAGLGNYVAANVFLDTLACYRRSLGLPGVSIAWGPWARVGMAETVGSAREAQWANEGLAPIDRRQGLEAFALLLGQSAPAVSVMSVDWRTYAERFPEAARSTFLRTLTVDRRAEPDDRAGLSRQLRSLSPQDRRARLVEHIRTEVALVLGLPNSQTVDAEVGLFRMGMDSLTSMELRNRLQRDLDCSLPTTLTFKYPTVSQLAEYLAGRLHASEDRPAGLSTRPVSVRGRSVADRAEPIAIVGMGCRFPGNASSPEAFWELLRDGVDAIRELPPDRWNLEQYYDPEPGTAGKTYARHGGYLDGIDKFDAAFFGISPREAASMDPQHRLLLEVCWEALEHAAIAPTSLAGARVGVFAGIGQDDYAQRRLRSTSVTEIDHFDGTGNLFCFAPGRLAYFLGLRGPNMAIDTACSSSLVAVQLAAQSLRAGECDLALAAAVHLAIAPEITIFLSRARVLSRDGRCKTFDERADGFGRGEGCGAVVLKRLSDAVADGDRILALIRGGAVNHDGRSSGLTVPNEIAQTELIEDALRNAGIDAAQVSYVEAHGTGTSLGDPIEVNALVGALCADRPRHTPLLIGSVKTNVGHLEAAAGMAGLIKVVLALQHVEIPSHLHFQRPNPHIEWDRIPVEVVADARAWPRADAPRIAGVSSFGFSGTNAHVLVQEAPEPSRIPSRGAPLHVLPLSARSGAALRHMAERYRQHLIKHPELEARDMCGTASVGRSHFKHRLAITSQDATGIRERLEAFLAGAPADGLRVGEADEQAAGAADESDRTPQRFADLFVSGADLDWSRLYPKKSFNVATLPTYAFERERYWLDAPDGPVTFESTFASTRPAYLDHHRVFGAAVFPAAGFVELALAAGQRVFGSSNFTLDDIEIPRALVLPDAGTITVQTIVTRQDAGRYAFTIQSPGVGTGAVIHVTGRMSAVGEPTVDRLADLTAQLKACPEELDVPQVYRAYADRGVVFGADFRALRQLRRGSGRALAHVQLPDRLLQDLGAHCIHPVLLDGCFQSSAAAWFLGEHSATYLPVSVERVELIRSPTSDVWCLARPRSSDAKGASRVVDLEIFDASGARVANVTGLALRASNAAALLRASDSSVPDWSRWLYALEWREVPRRGAAQETRRWLLLADRQGVGRRLAERLRAQGDEVVEMARGDRGLPGSIAQPVHVVHLWSLDAGEAVESGVSIPDTALENCESVLSLLSARQPAHPLSLAGLWLVTRGAQAVTSGEVVAVEQSPLWSLDRVIALEHPDLAGACIDLDPNQADAAAAGSLFEELSAGPDRSGVAFRGGKRYEVRLVPRPLDARAARTPRIDGDASYLVTGGFGALGSMVADWLVSSGARHLVLCGRREPSARVRQMIGELERRGARVMVRQVDVSDKRAVEELIETVAASMPPLRGIVHAAGVLEDATLQQSDARMLTRVFAPKVAGAWNLHTLTRDVPLEFFVCFSSAAAMIGSAGQGLYAAANGFMDALAARREVMGLCGVSISWGAWSESGMAAAAADRVQARWASRGVASVSPRTGLEILGRLAAGPTANVGILPIDWDTYLPATYGGRVPPLFEALARRPAAAAQEAAHGLRHELECASVDEARTRLVDLVRAEIMSTLALPNPDAIGPRVSFFDLGLDSLTAIELRHRLCSRLGAEIGSTIIFDYPTLEQLGDQLLTLVAGRPVSRPAGRRDDDLREPSDDAPEEPLEQAIADELERLESLIAGQSDV